MHHVVCFGEILWDRFEYEKKAGGAPMNVALHLYKQGVKSILISALGTDSNGDELLDFLNRANLDTAYIQKNSFPTGIVDVQLDDAKQASYTILKPVAWDEITYRPELDELLSKTEAVIFGSLACRSKKTMDTLLTIINKAPLKIFDINLRPPHFNDEIIEILLRHTDILKINEHELEYLSHLCKLELQPFHSALAFLSKKFDIKTIILTLGADGARIWHEGYLFTHPGYKVAVADTVGAGDAFLATFISGLLHKYPMQQILIRSCAAGALVASHSGGNPDYTTADIFKICNT